MAVGCAGDWYRLIRSGDFYTDFQIRSLDLYGICQLKCMIAAVCHCTADLPQFLPVDKKTVACPCPYICRYAGQPLAGRRELVGLAVAAARGILG